MVEDDDAKEEVPVPTPFRSRISFSNWMYLVFNMECCDVIDSRVIKKKNCVSKEWKKKKEKKQKNKEKKIPT